MTLTFHVLWMVCALASLVFAAASARPRWHAVLLAIAFIAAAAVLRSGRLPAAEWIAAIALVSALVPLLRPGFAWSGAVGAVGGGVLAAVWSALLDMQGVPHLFGYLLVIAALTISWSLARGRGDFAPDDLRDEGLTIVAVIAFGLAVLPGILDGWQTALALNAQLEANTPRAMPTWALSAIGMALVGGAAHAMWSRR